MAIVAMSGSARRARRSARISYAGQASPTKMRFEVGDRVREDYGGVVGVVERVDSSWSSPGYSIRLEESRYPQQRPVGSILFVDEHPSLKKA